MFYNIITNVKTDDRVIALTFDDGPHPIYTPKLLEILNKHDAKATFFLIGEAVTKYPDVFQLIVEAGHEIGNHSWSHVNLTRVRSRFRRLHLIRKCSKVIAPYSKRLFRPPYGAHNGKIQFDSLILGYKLILWNVSAQDWTLQDADDIAEKIIRRTAPGNIFLLHDAIYKSHLDNTKTQFNRDPMLKGLDRALTVLTDKYHFITVSEMLKYGQTECNWPIESMA